MERYAKIINGYLQNAPSWTFERILNTPLRLLSLLLQLKSTSVSPASSKRVSPYAKFFEEVLPANISTSFQCCFQVDMMSRRRTTQIKVETTLCTSTLKFTTLNNVESTLSISLCYLSCHNLKANSERSRTFKMEVFARNLHLLLSSLVNVKKATGVIQLLINIHPPHRKRIKFNYRNSGRRIQHPLEHQTRRFLRKSINNFTKISIVDTR